MIPQYHELQNKQKIDTFSNILPISLFVSFERTPAMQAFRGNVDELLRDIRLGRQYQELFIAADSISTDNHKCMVNEIHWPTITAFTLEIGDVGIQMSPITPELIKALATSSELRILDLGVSDGLLVPEDVLFEVYKVIHINHGWQYLEHISWHCDNGEVVDAMTNRMMKTLCARGRLRHIHLDGPVNSFSTAPIFEAIYQATLPNLEVLQLHNGQDLDLKILINAINSNFNVIPNLRQLSLLSGTRTRDYIKLMRALSNPVRRASLRLVEFSEESADSPLLNQLIDECHGMQIMFA